MTLDDTLRDNLTKENITRSLALYAKSSLGSSGGQREPLISFLASMSKHDPASDVLPHVSHFEKFSTG
jgi:hypothetical protein